MRARQARQILRADSLVDLGLALLLLLAWWEGPYEALGLPVPRPPVFAGLAGVLLLGFAYLLWVAPDYTVLGRRVAEAAAIVNGLAASVILLWLATGPAGLRSLGVAFSLLIGVAKAAFAVLEARLASAP